MKYLSWFAAACLLSGSSAGYGHHGVSGYDRTKPVNLEGVIVDVGSGNPHLYFTLEIRSANAKLRRVEIEAPSAARVNAFGTLRKVLKPGTKVTVAAFGRLKNPEGANYKGLTVTLPDGSVHALESVPGRELVKEGSAAQTLAGRWVPASTNNFSIYSIADAGARAVLPQMNSGNPQAIVGAAATSCAAIANEPLPFLMAGSGGLRSIEVSSKAIVVRIDSGAGVRKRVVDLERTTHPAKVLPTSLGHSIGRWEGSTLVIDTIGFEIRPPDAIGGVGRHRHVIERLTLTDDRRHIKYDLVVEDPDYYPAPFRFSMLWTHRADLAFSDASCDDRTARKYLSID